MKKVIFFIVRIFISAGLIIWAFSRVDLQKVKMFFLTLETREILLILAMSLLNWVLQYIRYLVILNKSIIHYNQKQALISFLAGFALRLTVPGGHGEIGKLMLIPGKVKNRLTVYGIEKFTSFLIVLFLFGFSALKIFPGKWYLVFFSLIPILTILLYSKLKGSRIAKSVFITDLSYGRLVFKVALITVAVYTIFILQYWTILSLYGMTFWTMASINIIILVSTFIPVSISGIGIRENVAVALLQPFGIPSEVGLGVPLLVFTFNVLFPASVGAILLAFHRNIFKHRTKETKQ